MAMPPAHQPCVLITGSSGLIGRRLTEALRRDYPVIGFDLRPPEDAPPGTAFIRCDLTDDDSVKLALAEVRRDFGVRLASVVHLAAYYDFAGEPSPLYRELTVEGTRRLLTGLQSFETEQFIFSSTLLVMKPSEEETLSADSAVEAEWDYPRSKLAAEQVIAAERGATPALILRIAGVYDEDGHSVPIAQQISRIHQRQLESYFFPGDSSRGQSFIHLDDLIDCIRTAIAKRGQLPPFEKLLIGEDDVMSYADLQERLGELIHDRQWPTIRIPKAFAKAGAWVKEKLASDDDQQPFIKPWMIDLADQHYAVSTGHARSLLGWSPRHSLRETLPEMVRRLHQDPQRWYEVNGLPAPEDLSSDVEQEIGR